MFTTHHVVSIFSVAMMVLGASVVLGQNYPDKPIRIVSGGVGGSSDVISRLIAQGISDPLGQPMIIENRPITRFGEILKGSTPDRYTLLVSGNPVWIGPLLRDNTRYDPVKDFAPISMLVTTPYVLLAQTSLPVKSVKELIALAKAKPGVLNFSSTGVGSAGHLTTELFKSMAGVDMVAIFFKGSAQATLDLISGEVQLTFTGPASVMPHLKAGRLRSLAVTGAQPSALFPGLPTVAATVLGYESAVIQGMFAPAKTPATIINRLNQEVVRVLNQTDVKERVISNGYEAAGSSPADLAATVKSEIAKWGKVLKDAGIKAE